MLGGRTGQLHYIDRPSLPVYSTRNKANVQKASFNNRLCLKRTNRVICKLFGSFIYIKH